MEANVDLINNGQAVGPVANAINNKGQLNIGAMRPFIGADGCVYITTYKGGDPKDLLNWNTQAVNANALLRRDEWKQLDDVLIDVGRTRLGGIQDLIDKNLVFNLGNAMGTTVLEWHDVNGEMEAVVTMDAITRSKNDKVTFQHNYLPIPIIHADYEINARTLAMSRNMGNPIDTISAERAARSVAQKLEDMLFTNTTYSFGEKDSRSRNSIYSYLNFPDRNQISLSAAWNESGKTPAQILANVVAMKNALTTDFKFGPYMLYIPTLWDTVLDDDYSIAGGSSITTRERVMKVNNLTGIRVIDTLPANTAVMVQMTSDCVRLIRGMGMQNIEWEQEGRMITKYKVMTIQVPQLRSDANGKSGICVLS
jgi:uncharacterized linocin/CFP29 family protein